MRAWSLSILGLLFTGHALAIPHRSSSELSTSVAVYLKPFSSIPTGHYNIQQLQKNMVAQDRARWVFVKTAQGSSGWALKHQLLNPLHFSTKAKLMANSPVYKERHSRSPLAGVNTSEESTVAILQLYNEWVEISLNGQHVWTPVSQLFPIEKDPGYFYAKKSISLREGLLNKSKKIKAIPAGGRLTPLEIKGDFAKVSYEESQGFVSLHEVVARLDIALKVKTELGFEAPERSQMNKKIFAIYVNPLWLGTGPNSVNLYQQPSVSSPLVAQMNSWSHGVQQDSLEQEWGVSLMKELGGRVYWEIPNSDFQELAKLNLNDIQKMIHNPLFTHLRIASAGGLFRSTDGVHWAPLREFQNQNPAFTFAKDGLLFVEDKVSFDNGEHFAPYVMWSHLLRALHDRRLAVARGIRILNIETVNASSQKIVLDIDVGTNRAIKVYTADRGQSWSVLKF